MLPSGSLSLPLEELRIDVRASQTPQAAQLPVRPKGKGTVDLCEERGWAEGTFSSLPVAAKGEKAVQQHCLKSGPDC